MCDMGYTSFVSGRTTVGSTTRDLEPVHNLRHKKSRAQITLTNQIKMSERGNAAKCWCFTLHCSAILANLNEVPDDVLAAAIKAFGYFEAEANEWPLEFGFAGLERAPSTGGYHVQGYIKLAKKQRLSFVSKLKPTGAHWEIAKADWEFSHDYCTKEKAEPHFMWWQFGDLPEFKNNGEREKKRWKDARAHAVSGNIEEIDDQIFICQYNTLKAIARDYQKEVPPLTKYNNEWIWGSTGSGKSTLARKENPGAYHKLANKWWCAYREGQTVLLEDLDPRSCEHLANFLKVWMDTFPFTAESKGASRQLRPPKIVVTSQYQIEECFNELDAAAIRRRCKVRKIESFVEVPDTYVESTVPGTVSTVVLHPDPNIVATQVIDITDQ